MEAYLDNDMVGRFLNRVENADESFDYLMSLRALLDSMDLVSGGLAHSKDDGSQSVLWNAPDERIGFCSKELTRKRQHPTIKIAASRRYPFPLSDFASEFSEDSCASELLQNFKQIGLEEAYAVPVHTPGDYLHVFVLGHRSTYLNTDALLTIQAACQGVVGKMMKVSEELQNCGRPVGNPFSGGSFAQGRVCSQNVAHLGIRSASNGHFQDFLRQGMIPGANLNSIADATSKIKFPPDSPSLEITDLLDVLDVVWGRYDAAIEADDAKHISILSDQILDLTRRIDELNRRPLSTLLNDNAVVQ